MRTGRKAARAGLAAVALGLSLAGPQLGVASADSQDGTVADAADTSARGGAARASAARSQGAIGGRETPARTARLRDAARLASPAPSPRAARAVPASAVAGPSRRTVREGSDALAAARVPSPPMTSAVGAAVDAGPVVAAPSGTASTVPAEASAPTIHRGRGPEVRQLAARAPSTPSTVAPPTDMDAAVRRNFNFAESFLDALPNGPLTDLLGGALQLLRRSLFNTAPLVIPSSQTTSDADGTISGLIGAIDVEGDQLTYAVVGDPLRGSVDVDADGYYTYTPGADYSGSDSFTVRISQDQRPLSLLDLADDGSREVTIQIGAPTYYDDPDVAVNIPDTAGRITLQRSGFAAFTGTVTLTNLTPDTEVMWMDTSGRIGRISVEALTENYGEFKTRAADNGATVDVTLAYTDADGTQRALLLNNVELVVDAAGDYVFSGDVAPAPEINKTSVDVWDVVGKGFKPMFDDFRTTYNLESGWGFGQFETADIDFTGADFYADTLTPRSYELSGLYAQDSEQQPTAVSPPTQASTLLAPQATSLAAAPVTLSPVTASVSLGNTVVIGRKDGSVQLWTDGVEKPLQDAGWNAGVKTLLPYNLPLKDVQGNTVYSTLTGYISGTTLTVTALGPGSKVVVGSEITGEGVAPGTTITKFIDQTATCINDSCDDSGNGVVFSPRGGTGGYPGTYQVSIAQTVGSPVPNASPDGEGVLAPAGIVLTQKGIPATAAGFVVGLENGSVQMYTATTGWTELHGYDRSKGAGWQVETDSGPKWYPGGAVTSIINYGEGIVVGLGNGAVLKWNGPGSNTDPSTWKDNWRGLRAPTNQAVTAMMPYRDYPRVCAGGCDGFLVGLSNGTVLQYNEADKARQGGWTEKVDVLGGSVGSAVKAFVLSRTDSKGFPLFAVGFEDGTVKQWTNYSVETLKTPDSWFGLSQRNITAMTRFGDNFIVGLSNGGVFMLENRIASQNGVSYYSPVWTELRTFKSAAVQQIIPFESATVGKGVVVGLSDGSVYAWTGKTAPSKPGAYTADTGADYWRWLHDKTFGSEVVSIVPVTQVVAGKTGDPAAQDGVIVGLANGRVEQWSGLVTGKASLFGLPLPEGQLDWTTLIAPSQNPSDGGGGGSENYAQLVLNRRDPFACSGLRCTQPGALQDAVTFAKDLARAKSPGWGNQPGYIGSSTDPIFGNPLLQAAPAGKVAGTYIPVALYKKVSPGAVNLAYPVPITFEGSIEKYDSKLTLDLDLEGCDGVSKCSILTVKKVTGSGQSWGDLKEGMLIRSDTLLGIGDDRIQPDTFIVKDVTDKLGGYDYLFDRYREKKFVVSGLPQYTQLSKMKAVQTPSVKLGLDVIASAYGYLYMPDGFFPKFKASNWSAGAVVAAPMGLGLQVTPGSGGALYAPSTSYSFPASVPGPFGFDSFQFDTGVKFSAGVTLNGVERTGSTLDAHAYAVPGIVFSYNTVGAPSKMQAGFSYYLDVDARDFETISGFSITGTVTPFVSAAYGIMIPQKIKFIGGWSLFKVGGGFENPISASLCVDAKSSCPAPGSGSGVANFYGAINDGTFRDTVKGAVPNPTAGNILTVTEAALFNPTPLAVGQLVTGPGVLANTVITKYVGKSANGEQYEVSTCADAATASGCSSAVLQSTGGGLQTGNPLTAYRPGSYGSVTFGSRGLLTFHAGLLEAFTSKFSYDAKVPLYEVNYVVGLPARSKTAVDGIAA